MRRFSYIVPETFDGASVNAFARKYAGMSLRFVRSVKFLPEGITVNGQRVTTRALLRTGDEIVFTVPDENNDQVVPVPGDVDIIWENADLVLVSKPAGMTVHPCHGHYDDTLLNYLAWHYREKNEHFQLRPVGRLDKDTSGLIFIAKNKYAVREMEKDRENGILKRVYLAMAEGRVGEPGMQGVIDQPIGRDASDKNRYEVREDGKPSRTGYEVLDVRDICADGKTVTVSLVRLKLETGRTHQIRVHMAWLGHPLVGDPIYGHAGLLGLHRAALHSLQIRGQLPGSGEPFDFTAPVPEDFAADFLNSFSNDDSVI